MMGRIYFDHNASSPLRPEAREAMVLALGRTGNASSVHGEGRAARRIIEDAREQVAALVGARPAEVVFTSGATEANAMALGAGWDTIWFAPVEHESVLATVARCGARAAALPVDGCGVVDFAALADAVGVLGRPESGRGALLTLQMANNETGVCQDVAAAAVLCRTSGIALHTDAVQAAGRITVDFAGSAGDLMSLSSHKLGGPMGAGALVVRESFDVRPLIVGGGQERRRRAGTENVAAIAGFGAAAAAAAGELDRAARRLAGLRERLEAGLREIAPGAIIVGSDAPRLPNTCCVAVPGEAAETMVIKLDLAGIAVSAGAACSSGKVGASHVLAAMGLAPEVTRAAIRVSIGWTTTTADLDEFLCRFRALRDHDTRAVA